LLLSKKSVVFILIAVFFIYISVMLLLTYLPKFLEFIEVDSTAISLTITFIMSTFFIFPPFLGMYSDKFQNRIYFIFSLPVGILITLVLLLFTSNIIILNILLFIFGFFASFLTVYLTLFSELVQNDKKWVSYYNSVCSIGSFTGVLIGGVLIDIFTIGNIFLFTLITFLLSIIFIIFIRENRQLILDINKNVNENFEKEVINNAFEKDNSISRSVYYSLFFRNFGIIPILNVLVIIMNPHIHSTTSIGFLVGLNPLLQFFVMIIIGKVLNEKNIKLFMILGYVLSVVVIFGYIISVDFWSFFTFQVILAIGYSMFWIATIVYIAQNSTPANKGRFMGYATTSVFAGTTTGGLFFSLLLAGFHSNYYVSMSFMIIFPVISIIIILFVFKLPKKKII
jgi:MFS family permease